MNSNQPKQPVASASKIRLMTLRIDPVQNRQLEQWLDQSLEALVDQFSEYVTANSNRRFFDRSSESR